MEPLSALDWQEVFLAGASAIPSRSEQLPAANALALALAAMAAKSREIAERQQAARWAAGT